LITVPLDDAGNASYTTGSLSAGRHFITASYSGDPNYGTGSVVLVQPVLQTSTVTLTASPNPSVFGQAVTFTATVAAGGPTQKVPEGAVTFLDGDTILWTVALNPLGFTSSNGKVSFTTSALTGGSHSITAVYSGDTNFTGNTSDPFTLVVNSAATSTTLSSSMNPSVSGQAVTFTATVHVPGSGTPTGDLTFMDGDTVLGTGTLDVSGKATFTTTDLEVGPHSITAVYGGDGNFAGSMSAVLTQTVNPGGPGPHTRLPQNLWRNEPVGRTGGGQQVFATPVANPADWLVLDDAAAPAGFIAQARRKGWEVALLDRFFASLWE
jgi:hypothetical protein